VVGFKISSEVIAGYAKKVDTMADELSVAARSVADGVLTVDSFGGLGAPGAPRDAGEGPRRDRRR
jgi:hypothetical protein